MLKTSFSMLLVSVQFSSVQSLSHVWFFVTPWTEAHQASLPITNFQSLLKLMSIEPVMSSNHLILCHPLLPPSIFPSIFSSHLQSFLASSSFQMSQLFESGCQSIGVSASASVLPMNTQDWSPLGWTGKISIHPAVQGTLKSLLQHHSSTASVLLCSAFL